MKAKSSWMRAACLIIAVFLSLPLLCLAQQEGNPAPKMLSQAELAQLLAPIALYPDDLVAQILMASTYPLEVVQADRWAQQNKSLKGDALAQALEKQKWDPSVKSLVNFPSVLSAMSQKLDLTTSVGDAYLAQPKDVMDTIQDLRGKAQAAGNLQTTKEQQVVVEQQTIVIKQADPQVVYVPSYNPTVVYGAWPYPAAPPYSYYPPPAYPGLHFATGVAVGMAWGYAWGHANWHGGNVDVDINRNTNINRNINRGNYARGGQGRGTWQHNPAHRKNVAYRDGATSRKYGQSSAQASQRRAQARGYGDRGGAGAGARPGAGTMDRGARGSGPTAGSMDRGGRGGAGQSAGTMDRGGRGGAGSGSSFPSSRDSAFSGASRSGSQERMASQRGQASRSFGGGASRSGSSFGSAGGGRSGGGFGGGGGRGGGGGGGGRRR
jgi:hypothetical protein